MKNLATLILLLIFGFVSGQTTSSGLKAQIDTDITNKTGAASISKTNVGSSIKSVVDYVVQEKADILSQIGDLPTGATYKGDWTSGAEYAVNDIVSYWDGASAWLCKTANSGVFTPVQSSEWVRLGIGAITTDSRLTGAGTSASPLRPNYYEATLELYATGGAAPLAVQNFFNANWALPDGVSFNKVRTGTGTYELQFSGDESIPYLDVSDGSVYFQVRFYNNPNIKVTSISSVTASGTTTLKVEFTNTIDGVLTDNFTRTIFEVRFY